MQDINRLAQTNGIDRAKGIHLIILHDLKHTRAAETFKRPGLRMASALLRQIKRIAKKILYILRQRLKIFSGLPHPKQRFYHVAFPLIIPIWV